MVQQGKTEIERINQRAIEFNDHYSRYDSVRPSSIDIKRVGEIYDAWTEGLRKQCERDLEEFEKKLEESNEQCRKILRS